MLGVVFAVSICPSSAAIFFGSLIPLAAKSDSAIVVPLTYGIATGAPVLVFALGVAFGARGIGRAFDQVARIERWLRIAAGLVLVGVGIYLCVRTNFAVD